MDDGPVCAGLRRLTNLHVCCCVQAIYLPKTLVFTMALFLQIQIDGAVKLSGITEKNTGGKHG